MKVNIIIRNRKIYLQKSLMDIASKYQKQNNKVKKPM